MLNMLPETNPHVTIGSIVFGAAGNGVANLGLPTAREADRQIADEMKALREENLRLHRELAERTFEAEQAWRRYGNSNGMTVSLMAEFLQATADTKRLKKLADKCEWDGFGYWFPEVCIKENDGDRYTEEPSVEEVRAAIDRLGSDE